MPAGPARWWDLWWSACDDDVTRFEAVRRQPIYRLWWLAEHRLAQVDLEEARAERREAEEKK